LRVVARRGGDERSILTGKLTTKPFFQMGRFGKFWEITAGLSDDWSADIRAPLSPPARCAFVATKAQRADAHHAKGQKNRRKIAAKYRF